MSRLAAILALPAVLLIGLAEAIDPDNRDDDALPLRHAGERA